MAKAWVQTVLLLSDDVTELVFELEAGNGSNPNLENSIIVHVNDRNAQSGNKTTHSLYLSKEEITQIVEQLLFWQSKL